MRFGLGHTRVRAFRRRIASASLCRWVVYPYSRSSIAGPSVRGLRVASFASSLVCGPATRGRRPFTFCAQSRILFACAAIPIACARGLTRRSTRTFRMQAFGSATVRRLASFVRPHKTRWVAGRLRFALRLCSRHHRLWWPCSWHFARTSLRPCLGHRSVCVSRSAALSFVACPSARNFAKSTGCGLTRRSRGRPACGRCARRSGPPVS